MTFTSWWNRPAEPKVFTRSDIAELNRKNRERRELQEQFENARREVLNKNKKYVQ